MIRFCHRELVHLLGKLLLLACFVSEEALQIKYLPYLMQLAILLIPLTSTCIHQNGGLEDLLWQQRKQLKVFPFDFHTQKHCVCDVNLTHDFSKEFLTTFMGNINMKILILIVYVACDC